MTLIQVRDINQIKVLKKNKPNSIAANVLTIYALIQICLVIFLWFNHIGFPLNLEAMELTRVQHLDRILKGLPLYPAPSSDFIALAYNPLSYFLTVPLAWVFGNNLFTIRLFAILGTIGASIVIFLSVRQQTKSYWWGLMAVGLFAAAYGAMDSYLDNGHTDSWLIFSILLGCYLIEQKRSQRWNLFGTLLLVAAFWFKQQGAIFAIGGVLYLTWREGWKRALPIWLLAILLGPVLYIFAPKALFGEYFHYFTWQVPRQWSEFHEGMIRHMLRYHVFRYYFVLFAAGCITSGMILWRSRNKSSIWYFMFPIALLSGAAATLTPGSLNNVYIPMGTWFIIVGILGLKQFSDNSKIKKSWRWTLLALALSFLLLIYNPQDAITPFGTTKIYQDFVTYLKTLPGKVYAPWIGQLQNGYRFYPSAHWVPLNDLIRGPGRNEANHPEVRKILAPVLNPTGDAYLLMPYPLEGDGMLNFLTEKYVLDTDLGDRFKALHTEKLKQVTLDGPRFLYRYSPNTASKQPQHVEK
jgi:hypothetical protein